MIGEPPEEGSLHVKVRDGGLDDAAVLRGAEEGLAGDVAYSISSFPVFSSLIPQTVEARIETTLVKPSVTGKKEKLSVEALVVPHSPVLELHAVYPVNGTPPVSVTVFHDIVGTPP